MALIARILLALPLDGAGRLTLKAGSAAFMRQPDLFHLLRAERVLLRREDLLCHESMCQVAVSCVLDAFLTTPRPLLGGSYLTAIQRLLRDLRLIDLSQQSIDVAVVVLHEIHGSCLVLALMYIGCGGVGQPSPRRIQMTSDCLELLLPLKICFIE